MAEKNMHLDNDQRTALLAEAEACEECGSIGNACGERIARLTYERDQERKFKEAFKMEVARLVAWQSEALADEKDFPGEIADLVQTQKEFTHIKNLLSLARETEEVLAAERNQAREIAETMCLSCRTCATLETDLAKAREKLKAQEKMTSDFVLLWHQAKESSKE